MDRFISPLLITSLMLLAAITLDWDVEMIWHDQQRIAQIILLIAALIGSASIWRRGFICFIMNLPRWVRQALFCAFGLGLVSVVTASYPRFAVLEWVTMMLLLGLASLLAIQARRVAVPFDIWSIRLVVALAVMIALKIMMGYLAAVTAVGHLDTIMLFEGTFSNRRFFGQVASMVVPLLAYPILRGGLSRGSRGALFFLLAVWWMLVIVSGTRGTWMALAVAAAVLAAFAWRASVEWLRIQVWAFGVGVLLFGILFMWLPGGIGLDASIENRLINPATLSGREILWSLAWAQMQAHPWLGVGPMHLAAIRNDFGAHPHNAVLQLGAEWGLPAALALILPAAAGVMRLLAVLRKNQIVPNALLVCLTASLLAAAAQSMVDGVIVIPYTQTLLALVAGWTLGVYFRGVVMTPVAADSRMMRMVIPVLSVFALAALLNGVFPEVLNRAELTQAYADAGKLILPRFWGVGWIP